MESGPIPHTAGGNALRAALAIRPPFSGLQANRDKELRDSGGGRGGGDEGKLG